MLQTLLIIILLIIAVGFAAFALVSLTEGHQRAARLAACLALISLAVLGGLLLLPNAVQIAFAALLGAG
jgi:hypothetical protein